MSNRNVKLKNLDGEYLYPYTENFPKDTSPVSGSTKAITSGAVYTALQGKLNSTATAARATADANGNDIASTYMKKTDTATKATADASGNNIVDTYMKKTETAAKATADASGNNIANTYLKKTDTAAKATADASGNNIANTYALKNQAVTTLATSGTITLQDNSINRIAPTGTVTFSLPSVTNHTIFHQILIQMTLSASRTISLGTTTYFGGEAPSFEAGKYNIIYEHNGSTWVVGSIKVA